MTGGKVRVHAICPRCAERHHHFAYCKDGERRVKAAPPFRKGEPLRGGAKRQSEAKKAREAVAVPVSENELTVAASTDVTEPAPALTVVPRPSPQSAREELRRLAASLSEDDPQRRAIELLVARDEAREGHAAAEAELRRADPTAHLPVPTILRDTSEDAGRHLGGEIDRLIFAAGTSRAAQRDILPKEAQAVHDTLSGLEGRREAAAQKAEPPEHVPGSQPWKCHACNGRFTSGTMEYIRVKARAEPSWRFLSPCCGSPKVEIIEEARHVA